MRLRFDPERPIYQQIIDEFKRAIARGELAPGDRIPSQRDLATEARINPNTVQRAYREMEWLGLTETLRGQGTFVVQDGEALQSLRDDMAKQALQRFIEEMSALGFEGKAIVRMAEEAVGDEAGGAGAGSGNGRGRGDDDGDRSAHVGGVDNAEEGRDADGERNDVRES